jgi:carboxyl-terminal processing protease
MNFLEKYKENFAVWFPLTAAVLVTLGMLFGYKLKNDISIKKISQNGMINDGKSKFLSEFDEINRYINAKYIDGIDKDSIEEMAINEVLQNLDPHSVYINPADLQQVNNGLEGDFSGIGINFLLDHDTIVIINTLEGSPAQKIGLTTNDKIVAIDDTLISNKNVNLSYVYSKIGGKLGSTLKLGILKNGENTIKNFTLKRTKIATNSIIASYKVKEKLGYIKISNFTKKTYAEFMKSIEDLSKLGVEDYIIDLRQNPGGYLDQAADILNQIFEEKDKLLFYTKGRGENKTEYHCKGQKFFKINKLSVLIDEGTASASELIAGCLQDWDRGTIIGRKSFGKGLVQEQFDLSNGGALRLTVGKYYTPSGRCIQRPYKSIKFKDYYNKDSFNTIKIQDSTKYKTSKGKIVLAEGGIAPDIKLNVNPLYSSATYMDLQSTMEDFVVKFIGQNKKMIPVSEADFINKFSINDKVYDLFTANAAKKLTKNWNKSELKKIAPSMQHILKAYIGRAIFGTTTFFKILNTEDADFNKAVELM